jgi:D-glycero-alpha-D-manno-heptose-7-phosphate kinase
VLNELQTSLVVCFTGVSRRSAAIIVEQQRGMATTADHRPNAAVIDSLHQLKHDAMEMKEALLRGEIARMAAVLNRSWAAKQRTASGISTGRIDELYHLAFDHGAIGGKVSGAGGGGFMMFFVPPAQRIAVVRALNAAGGTASGVHLTSRGAESWVVQ